jgi:O-glycosyl hydrolase
VPQFLAFTCSPPGRITRNGLTFCDPDSTTTNLKPGFEPQYARYLADVLEHFRTDEGIAFNYISPINEPQWDWSGHTQEGNRADNATIQAIARSLHSELKRRRLPIEIALVESGSIPDMSQLNGKATDRYRAPYGDYVNRFIGDPSFRDVLSGRLGYHAYGSDRLAGKLVEDREALAATMHSYPGWKLWQTEYCVMDGPEGRGGRGRDLTMNTALDVARVMHVDLTIAGVSAWQWWLAVSPSDYKDGLVYTEWKRPGDPETIIPSRLLWTFGNYSRFIRPGMRRIELTGDRHDIRGLMGSAFKDQAGRHIVAVYLNVSTQDRQVAPQFFSGAALLRPDKIVPYVTSDRTGDELKPYPPAAVIDIPARSAVTLVASL